ncbi:MAG TPA: BatA domain-containing protein, partial [Candidatus Dormibacteraeota bacterium]|nr:BatA domain-containing protein [Candidatus Dormibacteraeota bacterium]
MSFLAPLFLIGALAVAAPILFHLIRRTSREKMPFSSLMFLQPTPPRVTRSSRLENLFLLLLRCLVLCLLALGFARPLLERPVPDDGAGQGRRIAVLVDASASMRRDNLWADARDRARQVLKRVTAADTVGLFLLDQTARPLMSFEQWTAAPVGDRVPLALQRLQSAQPCWSGTHLGRGLLAVTEQLEENAGRTQRTPATAPRQVVLITDLQEGMHLDGLQGFEWPRGLEIVLEPVKAKRPSNAGLQLLLEKDDTSDAKHNGEIRVRVSNSGDAKREQFQLGWIRSESAKGFVAPALDVYVPPGQSRVLTVPRPAAANDLELLQLTGDDEDFDNQIYVVNPKPEQVRVLFLGDDTEKDTGQLLYYLLRAFPETRRQSIQIIHRPGQGPVPPEDLYAAPLSIATDSLRGDGLQAARTFLNLGKPLLFVLKSAGGAPVLAELMGQGTLPAEEAKGANYALLGQVAFDHPLFASFADPRF